jgi:DNA-binding NarL/FixJ family response regulator
LLVVNAGDDLRAAISQIELFKVQHESRHVVLLADPGQHSGVQAVFRAGANGYLFMGPTTEQFIKALELVMLGDRDRRLAVLISLSASRSRDEIHENPGHLTGSPWWAGAERSTNCALITVE